jgi:hypothetical protein
VGDDGARTIIMLRYIQVRGTILRRLCLAVVQPVVHEAIQEITSQDTMPNPLHGVHNALANGAPLVSSAYLARLLTIEGSLNPRPFPVEAHGCLVKGEKSSAKCLLH